MACLFSLAVIRKTLGNGREEEPATKSEVQPVTIKSEPSNDVDYKPNVDIIILCHKRKDRKETENVLLTSL